MEVPTATAIVIEDEPVHSSSADERSLSEDEMMGDRDQENAVQNVQMASSIIPLSQEQRKVFEEVLARALGSLCCVYLFSRARHARFASKYGHWEGLIVSFR